MLWVGNKTESWWFSPHSHFEIFFSRFNIWYINQKETDFVVFRAGRVVVVQERYPREGWVSDIYPALVTMGRSHNAFGNFWNSKSVKFWFNIKKGSAGKYERILCMLQSFLDLHSFLDIRVSGAGRGWIAFEKFCWEKDASIGVLSGGNKLCHISSCLKMLKHYFLKCQKF